jgi:hypothetical protein
MPTIEPFPRLSEEMVQFCERSENEFTRHTPDWIAGCFELDTNVPATYGWRVANVAAIQRQVSGLKDYRAINRVFWEDQARNTEAYAIMTFWRGSEILKASIRSLNVGDVVTPAILVRSLLELTCTYLFNANIIEKSLSEIQFPPKTVVTSPEFEERVVKMIWGTRLGEPEPHLKQTNVLTTIQKLAKHPRGAELLPKYEFLCEVAHPNVIGNSRYWSHVERANSDGSNTVKMSRSARGDHSDEILEATLWAMGWSAGSLRNSFTLIHTGLAQLLSKLVPTQ